MSKRSSKRFRTAVLTVAGLSLGLAGAAQAQLKTGSHEGLGLTGANVPPLLKQIRADPYRVPADCPAIAGELAQIDAIMGPDVDKPAPGSKISDRVADHVRDMIPYRSVVRFLTQADAKDHKLQAAANAGYARRGFLRGLQAQKHCDGGQEVRVATADDAATAASATAPVTPAAETRVAEADARVVAADARVAADDARLTTQVAAIGPPPPSAGERLSDQMLRGPAPPAPPAAPAPTTHVVYRLIDVTSGREIVPDAPASDAAAPGGAR